MIMIKTGIVMKKIRLLMTTNDKFSNPQEEITALQEEIPEGA